MYRIEAGSRFTIKSLILYLPVGTRYIFAEQANTTRPHSDKSGIIMSYLAFHHKALFMAAASLRSPDMEELSSWWILAGDLGPGAISIAATSL